MAASEIEIATDAVRELSKYGVAELQYISAGFQPYSNAQRPDVVFWPGKGPNEGGTFFVELRIPTNPTQSLPSPEVLEEHRASIETDPPESLHFALATTRRIDESLHWSLLDLGIEVLDGIQSGSDLAQRIVDWSQAE